MAADASAATPGRANKTELESWTITGPVGENSCIKVQNVVADSTFTGDKSLPGADDLAEPRGPSLRDRPRRGAGARARWHAGSGRRREPGYHWQVGFSKQNADKYHPMALSVI
jgi:hypothetical protein